MKLNGKVRSFITRGTGSLCTFQFDKSSKCEKSTYINLYVG